jgi:pescadillo
VRERYPRFVDALSDLDDALTLTYLFAALPSNTAIKAKMGGKAKSLAAAWGAYCSTAGCITRSFISVKGVYLESSIRGIAIRWVVPHSFTQFMPEDVDYKVMATFFEFYETLLHFVLFKLYNDIGVRYPLPVVEGGDEVKGSASIILAANLRSLTNAFNSSENAVTNVVVQAVEEEKILKQSSETLISKSRDQIMKERDLLQTIGSVLKKVDEDEEFEGSSRGAVTGSRHTDPQDDLDDYDEDNDVDVAGPLKEALQNMADAEAMASLPPGETTLDDEAMKRRRLFAGLTFFLSREVPRGYLELICLAFGAKLGWEGPNSPIAADDSSITHHIVDRPKLPTSYNTLPKSREFVQPQWILDCTNFMFLLPIAKYEVGATLPPHLSPWVDNAEEGYKPAYAEEIERLKNGEAIDEIDANDNDEVEEGSNKDGTESNSSDGLDSTPTTIKNQENDSELKQSDDENSVVDNDTDDVSEDDDKTKAKRLAKSREKDEREAHELAKSMMSRKAAHLYGRMQHGLSKKKAKVDLLLDRRREIEHSKEKDDDGRSLQKQKVERLKKERKRIEDEYANTGGSMKRSKKKSKK